MKRLLVLAVTSICIVVLMSGVAVAARSGATCEVVPQQVPLGSSWEVRASGLTPNAAYYINVTQARDPSNGAHPNSALRTDENGSGSTVFPSTSWSPDGILTYGSFKVRVYAKPSLDPNASGTANCTGTVI